MAQTAPVEVDRPVDESDVVPNVPWIVIVWNDPINLMSYVTLVLRKLFGFSVEEATRLMLQVHNDGKAVVSSGEKEKAEFESLAGRIGGLRFIAPRKVGENDVLYGSVTSGDIAEFLKAKGIDIDKRKVILDEPVKHLGDHEVKIRLHPEVTATLKLLVSKEG